MARTPGPKKPELYPVAVGEKYDYWGEMEGWKYDPYNDTYIPDEETARPYLEGIGAIEPEPETPGYGEQVLPVAGTAGAIALANQIGKGIPGMMSSGVPEIANQGVNAGIQAGANAGAGAAGSSGAATGGLSASTPVATTTLADGSAGVVLADGSTASASSWGGTLSAALPWVSLAGISYFLGQNAIDDGAMDVLKGDVNSQNVTDAALNSNPITGWINPLIKPFGLESVGNMLGGGKSTDDYKQERRAALAEEAPGWAQVMTDIDSQREASPDANEGYWTEANDPTGKYVGQKWSWEAEQDIRRTTGDYLHATNRLGNAETFGDEWLQLPIEQREYITQKLDENGMYHSNKGDILIADDKQEDARKIYEEVKLQWNDPEFQKKITGGVMTPPPSASPGATQMGSMPQGTSPSQAAPVPRPGMMGSGSTAASSPGGAGGPGYDPDPNRPGHFIKRK